MESGAIVFLRVKVCLIHVIATSRKVRKKINLHGLHLAFPSYRANCICSLPCNIKDPILSQVISLLAFKASCKDPGSWESFEWEKDWRLLPSQKNRVFYLLTCLNGQWSAKMPLCLGEFISKIIINTRPCMLFKGLSFLSFIILSSKRIPTVNR